MFWENFIYLSGIQRIHIQLMTWPNRCMECNMILNHSCATRKQSLWNAVTLHFMFVAGKLHVVTMQGGYGLFTVWFGFSTKTRAETMFTSNLSYQPGYKPKLCLGFESSRSIAQHKLFKLCTLKNRGSVQVSTKSVRAHCCCSVLVWVCTGSGGVWPNLWSGITLWNSFMQTPTSITVTISYV